MARFCTNCGTANDDAAAFCSKCGHAMAGAAVPAGGPVAAAPAPATGAGGLADNVAGMLAYVTIIPAIIFLVMEPYNRNRFVRFHSFQCLFTAVALIVIHIVLNMVPLLGWAVSMLVSAASLVLWVILLVKAYNGQMWKLPVVGDLAEKQANAM